MFLEMLNYKIPCMKLYCKGCLNSNENKVEFMTVKYCYKWKQNVCLINYWLNVIILHHGTKDFSSNVSPDEIIKNILQWKLEKMSKTKRISRLTLIIDKLEEKRKQFNHLLRSFCQAARITFGSKHNMV